MLRLTINGKSHDVDVEPDTPLLWAIRDTIGMTGTKYGCGIAQCGACTVHIDGAAVRSCVVTASDAAGKKVATIEGLAANGMLTAVQQAWVDLDVPQCGYCQSGMIMAVSALLQRKAEADRRRHRQGDHQYLPLWDLPANACSNPRCGQRVRGDHELHAQN